MLDESSLTIKQLQVSYLVQNICAESTVSQTVCLNAVCATASLSDVLGTFSHVLRAFVKHGISYKRTREEGLVWDNVLSALGFWPFLSTFCKNLGSAGELPGVAMHRTGIFLPPIVDSRAPAAGKCFFLDDFSSGLEFHREAHMR